MDTNFNKNLLPQVCERIFSQDGYAGILPNFEYRPQQQNMALYCAQSYVSNDTLLFEAGTGVGKSLAYLIPGIIAAKRLNKQLVIATNTIALQQQILNKDLPRAKLIFESADELFDCADFKATLLVGRANYLCTNRLKRALANKVDFFNTNESAELQRIANWAMHTKTGLVEELDPPPNWEVWSWVNADSSSCTAKKCTGGDCFYQKIKQKIAGSDVIILNHSLLFTLLANNNNEDDLANGIIYPNDMLVIDEAHLIPEIVTDAFGTNIKSNLILKELNKIYDAKKKKGLITRENLADYYDKDIVNKCKATCKSFFEQIKVNLLDKKENLLLSTPNWADDQIIEELKSLADMLAKLTQKAKDENLITEIKDFYSKINSIKNALHDCIYTCSNEYVYWLEKSKNTQNKIFDENIAVRSAPLEIAPILRQHLFDKEAPLILTSATLAINNSIETFANQIGGDYAQSIICDSPFDYANNMQTFICTDLPEFDSVSKRINAQANAELIAKLTKDFDAGTLVLFTSYADLNAVADLLEKSEELTGINIYKQSKNISRKKLIESFERDVHSILLGTESFWTGVDIPGKSLSQVIITRLPFKNFSHPYRQAKADKLKALGQNSFLKISLPEAIIQFRQGVGRLIRHQSDRGIITILDKRILSNTYGKNFCNALPSQNITRFSSKNLSPILNKLKP